MSDEGNFVCQHVEQIRTASRDGDHAVGVDRTVSVEPRPSPSNQISQYQNVLLERNNSNTNINCSNKFNNMIHCIHKFELGFILLNKQMLGKFEQQLPPTFQLSKT